MKNVIRLSVTAVIVASVIAGLAGRTHAQFSLYDNFATGTIDPSLWQGTSSEGNFNAPTAEMIRTAETGALRLKLVAYGNDTSNSGKSLRRCPCSSGNWVRLVGRVRSSA